MPKILDVPYYSQHRDIKDEYWKTRACGILCLKSVLDYSNVKTGDIDDFIKLGQDKNAYGESGWIHQGLIDIAGDFGLNMERKEFLNELNEGIEKIIFSLKNDKPVLVSAIKRWKEKDKFHMVVLGGFEASAEQTPNGGIKGFYYNDSDYKDDTGKGLFVDIEIFKKYWRKLAIFVD